MDITKLETLKQEMIKSMYNFLNGLYEEDANLTNYPTYLPSFDEFICDVESIDFVEE